MLTPDPAAPLKQMVKRHGILVGIDSDGCVFDTMEIKQKECFIPNIIKFWGLQPIAKYVRETVEFVNLYSKWRGVNRWPALIRVFDLLADRQEVKDRNVKVPELQSLRSWVEKETKLSNAALRKEVERTKDEELANALAWSEKVNADIADMVHGIPPFLHVVESLQKLQQVADMIVVSQTPYDALAREWREHGIDGYVQVIAGQEMGSKSEHLRMAMDGRWTSEQVLMIGDALGDLKAAKANNALFYPIVPGSEELSWKRFSEEVLDMVLEGTYAGDAMSRAVSEFERRLPETPPWMAKNG